jgi:hypothetical protein
VLLLLIDASRDGSDELLDEDDICDGDVCSTKVKKHIIMTIPKKSYTYHFQVEVFLVVMLCSVAVGHQCSENLAASTFTLKPEATLHNVTTHKTMTSIFTAMKTSNLTHTSNYQ